MPTPTNPDEPADISDLPPEVLKQVKQMVSREYAKDLRAQLGSVPRTIDLDPPESGGSRARAPRAQPVRGLVAPYLWAAATDHSADVASTLGDDLGTLRAQAADG